MKQTLIFLLILIFCASASAQEKILLTWYDATTLGIDGKGWTDTNTPFDRFPSRAEKLVPDAVWKRSLNSAGLRVTFATDSTMIVIRWKLRHPSISSPYLSSMSVAGLDLYLREGEKWQWAATKPPKVFPETTETFLRGLSPVICRATMALKKLKLASWKARNSVKPLIKKLKNRSFFTARQSCRAALLRVQE